MVRVAAAHDQDFVAHALQAALADGNAEVVGIASSSEGALELVDELRPDLLVFDLELEGSSEAMDLLRERDSEVQIVALAPGNAAEARRTANEAGVAAYVRKDAGVREVAEALSVLGLLSKPGAA